MPHSPPLIALEEHYIAEAVTSDPNTAEQHYDSGAFPAAIVSRLRDLGPSRIADLDANGITMQVLSHGPLEATTTACQSANDYLASNIKSNPTRYAGFAMLTMSDPTWSADELSRCVKTHGFVGALINNHYHGAFYDDEKFWPVFARAVELDVPIYIHPTFAPQEMRARYEGNFSALAARQMSIAGWGWHADTGLHVLRLWTSGLFDRYPGLKFVIGHMGEMVPFQIDRILPLASKWAPERKRDILSVFRENFWVTTSAFFTEAPLACLLRICPIDRILFSVDYPFSANEKGREFVEKLKKSDLIDDEQLEMICFRNAQKLLGVKV